MKTFKIYLAVMLFLVSTSLCFSQDEIYNEKQKKVIVLDSNKAVLTNNLSLANTDSTQLDSLQVPIKLDNIDEYTTEQDYYDENYVEDEYVLSQEEIEEEERLDNESKQGNNEAKNRLLGAVVEVAVEVFLNVFLVFALGH